jgi:hypothetical protein
VPIGTPQRDQITITVIQEENRSNSGRVVISRNDSYAAPAHQLETPLA